MHLKSFFASAALICLISYSSSGQGNNRIIPTSPEASALAKMVNYPVSFNTGIPDISIPLYEVQVGGMNLPISLSYHAGGFKIQERATSIGLGWDLSSDIQISRSVNGTDDLAPAGYMSDAAMKTYYPPASDLFSTTSYPLQTGIKAYNIAAGLADGMPDKFYYKLLNKSGAFYIRKNLNGDGYTIVPVPYDNLNIAYVNGQFTITDTDGTSYFFGEQGLSQPAQAADHAIEFTGNMLTAWKCVKIRNATKTDSLRFSYQPKTMFRIVSRQESIEYYNNDNPCNMGLYIRPDGNTVSNPTTYEGLIGNHPFYTLASPKYRENLSSGVSLFHLPYLNAQNQVVDKTYTIQDQASSVSDIYSIAPARIDFRGGAIVFNGADQLSSIQVLDMESNEVKRFSFSQSYALPANLANAQNLNETGFVGTRYLDSLEFSSDVTPEKYRFLYENKFCFGSHLVGKDAWGYRNNNTREWDPALPFDGVAAKDIVQRYFYNQNSSCTNFIANVTFHIGTDANIENTSDLSARSGMLKRIIYPTGGYVDFEFESNMYKQNVGTHVERVSMSGGLRVKSINHYDGKSQLPSSQKYYRYGDLEDGIGILINSPTKNFDPVKRNFDSFSYRQTTTYLSGPGSTNIGEDFAPVPVNCFSRNCLTTRFSEQKTTYLPASSMDYSYPGGAPIYYTKVSEYDMDLGITKGKKVYTFYEPEYFQPYAYFNTSKIPGTNINVLQSDGFMGMQKSIEDYAFTNGKYSLAHSKEFQYTKYVNPAEIRVVYSYFNTIYQITSGGFSGDNSALYDQNTAGSTYSTDFTAGQYGIQVGKMLISNEIEKWIDNGRTVEQGTSYVYNNLNYMQPSEVIVSDSKGLHSRTFKYAYNYPGVSVYDQMKGKNMIADVIEEVSYNGSAETAKLKTNYAAVNSGAFLLPVSIQKSFAGNALETVLTYDFYDDHTNILQLTEKGSLIKSYIWGYNYKYPVAQIVGATYASATAGLNITALQSITDPIAVRGTLNGIRAVVPEALVSVYAYKPLVGILSESAPNGKTRFYEYLAHGRLSVIRDESMNIIQKFDYHMSGPTASFANTLYAVNTGIMSSYNNICGSNSSSLSSKRLVNVIRPGGIQIGVSAIIGSANAIVENDMATNWATLAGAADCYAPEATTLLKLNTWPSNPVVPFAYLDLIQDNGIAVSKFIPHNSSNSQFDELYVVPGNYKVSLRFNENYSGSLSWLQVSSPSGTRQYRSGESISFDPGQEYTFILFND